MRSPYCIGVWKQTLSEAVIWVDTHYLGEDVIQFHPDPINGIWVLLRVTGHQRKVIMESPETSKVI